MDIEYLLFLQNFRNSINDALTPFMEWISLFAVTNLIMIPAFVYWAVNKRKGLFTLLSYFTTVALNAVVKLTCCIYRPWIRDARVLPAGDAITTATGYSFPSGHTMTAGPIYGGLALTAWDWKRWVSVLCLAALIVTGFSRNYLGVHTPQDVLVGLALSAVMLWLMSKLMKYLEAHPEREDWFLLAGFVVGWLGIAYVTFKPYPMDYVNDKLLVDPQRMMNDGYGDIGTLIAFCAARFVERRWVKFTPTGLSPRGLTVCIVGLLGLWLMIHYMGAPLDNLLGSHWGHFATRSIIVFYSVVLYPIIIRLIPRAEE